MQEVLPGIWDWTARHENLGAAVHSHAVGGALIDPMLPDDGGLDALQRLEPERIVLSNRHHDRHAERIARELGLPVLCHRNGLHEFDGKALDPEPYDDGEVAPGIHAYEVLGGWHGECALHVPEESLLILGDTAIREGGVLAFVPDRYLGDDPEEEKRHIRAGLRGLLDLDFDHALFAHGEPLIGGAKDALREFLGA